MNSSNQSAVNEPPRFGLESRGRNKDINTRKLKELQKMKQLVVNEKAKKEEEKRLKKQPPKDPNQPKKIKSPQNNPSQPRPPLVVGTDIDKESLYPQSQDFDRDEINPNSLIYGTKKTVNGFQDNVILSLNQKEQLEIQMAIEESMKELAAAAPVDKVVLEMEEDFVLCEDEDDLKDNEKSIECWELMDESSSSHLVNLITTPYIRLNSDKEFPKLPSKPIHKQVNLTNPWSHSKHLIEAITQQS